MTERRYDEDEVRRIFDAATEVESEPAPRTTAGEKGSGRGLTLAELKEIAAEVDIPGPLVERAAAALDAHPPPVPAPRGEAPLPVTGEPRVQRVLGVPIGVDRDVILPRMLTYDEWGQLVLELRRTFSARGRLEEAGSLREWRNSNLFVALAPDGAGARLSMGTRKGNARPIAIMGLAFSAMAAILLVTMALTGEIAQAGAIATPLILGGMGLTLLGSNVLRLPPWARNRSRQMEAIAERALGMAHHPLDGPDEPPYPPSTPSSTNMYQS